MRRYRHFQHEKRSTNQQLQCAGWRDALRDAFDVARGGHTAGLHSVRVARERLAPPLRHQRELRVGVVRLQREGHLL